MILLSVFLSSSTELPFGWGEKSLAAFQESLEPVWCLSKVIFRSSSNREEKPLCLTAGLVKTPQKFLQTHWKDASGWDAWNQQEIVVRRWQTVSRGVWGRGRMWCWCPWAGQAGGSSPCAGAALPSLGDLGGVLYLCADKLWINAGNQAYTSGSLGHLPWLLFSLLISGRGLKNQLIPTPCHG